MCQPTFPSVRSSRHGAEDDEDDDMSSVSLGSSGGDEQEVEDGDLCYETTTENVCLHPDVLEDMERTFLAMAELASSPLLAQPVRMAAAVAAELMSFDGPLQTHGLVCVHKSCKLDFGHMAGEVEHYRSGGGSGTPPVSMRTVPLGVAIELVHMVLTLTYRYLREENQRAFVHQHLVMLESMLDGHVHFDFGVDPHTCVPLFTRGNVDPDGAPNVYS